jgi:hypothetical protein
MQPAPPQQVHLWLNIRSRPADRLPFPLAALRGDSHYVLIINLINLFAPQLVARHISITHNQRIFSNGMPRSDFALLSLHLVAGTMHVHCGAPRLARA